MSVSKQVTIGDQQFTVQRFRGLKAIMAMASMTRIAREVPDVMADAMKEYSRRNTVVITESMARLPRWSGFTKEDFDAAEAARGKREIELPTPMTSGEQIMYALPDLLQKARKEVTRLLALMIIPNEDLKVADKADKVEEALDKFEEVLLYDAELDQLVELAFATQDILGEQLGDKKDRLGNLLTSLWGTWRGSQTPTATPLPETTTSSETDPVSETSPTQGSTQPTSTPDAPISSTDSAEPTAGTETQPSTVSPGVS